MKDIRGDWQVQEAKSRLSELIAKARSIGPQSITRHGEPMVVVLSVEEFERLSDTQRTSLWEFFASLPTGDIALPERVPESIRDIDL